MVRHELKNCPRCGAEFECKSGSISLCQCQAVALNSEQAEYLARRYADCLCACCLVALRTEFNVAEHEARVEMLMARR